MTRWQRLLAVHAHATERYDAAFARLQALGDELIALGGCSCQAREGGAEGVQRFDVVWAKRAWWGTAVWCDYADVPVPKTVSEAVAWTCRIEAGVRLHDLLRAAHATWTRRQARVSRATGMISRALTAATSRETEAAFVGATLWARRGDDWTRLRDVARVE